MPYVSPNLLERAHRAALRGEYFHPGEVLLLSLPILVPEPPAAGVEVGLLSFSGFSLTSRSEQVVGVLTLTADVAYRECHGRIEEQSLHVGSPIQLDYCGYLQAAFRWVGSPGETTIRIGQWPEMAVRIRQQQQAQTLQQLLQAWYERRVPVWEMVGGQRTFLLKQNLSYEQIRAFEQQYGVKLYG